MAAELTNHLLVAFAGTKCFDPLLVPGGRKQIRTVKDCDVFTAGRALNSILPRE